MSRYFSAYTKPENALKRAEELLHVGQKNAALQALHDVITSKRHRTWQKSLESVMMKYVELCVESRKGRLAKEGLIQYRIVCQQVNVSSLEDVIKHFLKLATAKADAAQAAADELDAIGDLDAENTPENMMLSYVSAERGKERSDRQNVTPHFKFLWETYRNVLEILRNNSKLEALYAMTAYRAFQFCKEYKRTTEFRRLAEMLRNHLSNLNKYRDQRDRPDITLPETFQYYVETRFEQLKVATDLELWQEAFRSVEDIHGLVTLVKKSPKPQMMAIYYAKLTKIFWVSENNLYHAYAWYKLYNLSKTYNKNLAPTDVKVMASVTLLSTAAVSPYDSRSGHHFEMEIEKERNMKMANLLGFTLDPKRDTREVLSRQALLSELTAKGFLNVVFPEVRDLYLLLETQFHPLDFCQRATTLLQKLKDMPAELSGSSPITTVEWQEYVTSLEKVVVLRFLQQVASVYSTLKLSTLQKLIPFKSFVEVEKIIVDAVKYNFIAARIDHLRGCIDFGNHSLENEKMKQHITILSKRLNKAITLISPTQPAERQVSEDVLAAIEQEHKRALARKVYIERRKEEQERILLEQEREEEAKKAEQMRQTEEAEAKRLEAEARSREEDRIRRDIEDREHEEALALYEAQLKKKGGKKGKAVQLDENTKLDKRQLMADALQEQIKERQDAEKRLQKLAKQMDHLERAKREEETPLLAEAYEEQKVEDKAYHEETQRATLEQHRKQWESDLDNKRRLSKMVADQQAFAQKIVARRDAEFADAQQERAERVAEMRAMRAAERQLARRKELMRRLKAEEAELREAEEASKRKEEEERRAREDEARRAKEAELREREEEERRARMEREARPAPGAAAPGRYEPRRMGGDSRYEPRSGGGDRWGGGGGGGAGGGAAPAAGGGSRWEPSRGGGGFGGDAPPGRYEPRRDDRPAPSRWEPTRRSDAPPPPPSSGGGGRSRW